MLTLIYKPIRLSANAGISLVDWHAWHTLIRTDLCVSILIHILTHIVIHILIRVIIRILICMLTRILTHTLVNIRAHVCTFIRLYVCKEPFSCASIYLFTGSPPHSRTHRLTHSYEFTRICSCMHRHTYTWSTYLLTYAYTCIHMYIHKFMHMFMSMHAYIYTYRYNMLVLVDKYIDTGVCTSTHL